MHICVATYGLLMRFKLNNEIVCKMCTFEWNISSFHCYIIVFVIRIMGFLCVWRQSWACDIAHFAGTFGFWLPNEHVRIKARQISNEYEGTYSILPFGGIETKPDYYYHYYGALLRYYFCVLGVNDEASRLQFGNYSNELHKCACETIAYRHQNDKLLFSESKLNKIW